MAASNYSELAISRSGLPQSGKNIWKMKFLPGQGKVREICEWSGKFRNDLENLGKVREFENKWLWQTSENLFNLFKREMSRCTVS